MTTIVPIAEAKLTLEKLVAGALAGDEVIIEDLQAARLRLQPLTAESSSDQRALGLGSGNVLWISDSFDDFIDPDTDPEWADWAKEARLKSDLGRTAK